jgi:DNA-binding beta-propeller fold protein YncE
VFAADGGDAIYQIWRVERDGTLTALAGSRQPDAARKEDREGKDALQCRLEMTTGLAYDAAGNLYVAQPIEGVVLRLDPAGKLTRHAGSGLERSIGAVLSGEAQREREVPALAATLLVSMGLACDAAGNLYIAEVGTRPVSALAGLAIPAFEQLEPIPGRIRQITPDGKAITLAGVGSGLDEAAVRNPIGLAVTPEGRIFYVDNGSSQLKELTRTP